MRRRRRAQHPWQCDLDTSISVYVPFRKFFLSATLNSLVQYGLAAMMWMVTHD
jgi:hypothetical protein